MFDTSLQPPAEATSTTRKFSQWLSARGSARLAFCLPRGARRGRDIVAGREREYLQAFLNVYFRSFGDQRGRPGRLRVGLCRAGGDARRLRALSCFDRDADDNRIALNPSRKLTMPWWPSAASQAPQDHSSNERAAREPVHACHGPFGSWTAPSGRHRQASWSKGDYDRTLAQRRRDHAFSSAVTSGVNFLCIASGVCIAASPYPQTAGNQQRADRDLSEVPMRDAMPLVGELEAAVRDGDKDRRRRAFLRPFVSGAEASTTWAKSATAPPLTAKSISLLGAGTLTLYAVSNRLAMLRRLTAEEQWTVNQSGPENPKGERIVLEPAGRLSCGSFSLLGE